VRDVEAEEQAPASPLVRFVSGESGMVSGNRQEKTGGGSMDKKGDEVPKRDEGIKINWDESQMKTSYANVCNVSSTREEFTLLFGTNQTWQGGAGGLNVQLTNRIILNAFAAKRLAILTGRIVEDYESRFGELNLETSAPREPKKTG
jgi:hypothetical protein